MRHCTVLAIATLALVFTVGPTHGHAQEPNAPAQPAALTVPPDSSTPQFIPPSAEPIKAANQSATPAGELPLQPAILVTPDEDNPAAQATDPDFRTALAAAIPVVPAAYATEPYRLRLHNTHTLENIDIVYRIGDDYQPDAVARLNYFLRDHNTNDVIAFDPREFDLLHDILIRLRRPGATIDIVCGYRTQETNDVLRASSQGVAEHSQHILGHAIDIQIPGSSTVHLRNAALSLNEGGVGYYPTSHFVHVDVGAIRTWTYSPRSRRRGHLRRASAHHRQIAQHRHHTTHATGM